MAKAGSGPCIHDAGALSKYPAQQCYDDWDFVAELPVRQKS
jgi:hypothetical protein